ncbi:hypothetical protein IAR50_005842 [Cryptococcus sp. DSM 104548]
MPQRSSPMDNHSSYLNTSALSGTLMDNLRATQQTAASSSGPSPADCEDDMEYDGDPDDPGNYADLNEAAQRHSRRTQGSSISAKVSAEIPALMAQIDRLKEEFCDKYSVAFEALERRLVETKKTRAASTWVLWQRSNISRNMLNSTEVSEAPPPAAYNHFSIRNVSEKEGRNTQALVDRVKRSSALYIQEKARLGEDELRRVLEEDLKATLAKAPRMTSLNSGDRFKKWKTFTDETYRWMELMECRYQVSSILMVASSHLSDSDRDEVLSSSSARRYMDAKAKDDLDFGWEVARMGAALRGDRVMGGGIFAPPELKAGSSKPEKEARTKKIVIKHYAAALNALQEKNGQPVKKNPQRVEWSRLRQIGLMLVQHCSIDPSVVSKRGKTSSECDIVAEGFLSGKIKFVPLSTSGVGGNLASAASVPDDRAASSDCLTSPRPPSHASSPVITHDPIHDRAGQEDSDSSPSCVDEPSVRHATLSTSPPHAASSTTAVGTVSAASGHLPPTDSASSALAAGPLASSAMIRSSATSTSRVPSTNTSHSSSSGPPPDPASVNSGSARILADQADPSELIAENVQPPPRKRKSATPHEGYGRGRRRVRRGARRGAEGV